MGGDERVLFNGDTGRREGAEEEEEYTNAQKEQAERERATEDADTMR